MTPAAIAAWLGVPLIDYRRPGDAVLVSSGCGIMMSIMDQVPRYRWSVDADAMRSLPPWRIEWFITAIDRNTDVPLLGVAGWFSLDDPTYLRAGLEAVRRMRTCSYSGGIGAFSGEARTLSDFVRASLASELHLPETERPPHRDGLGERPRVGELPVPKHRVRPRVIRKLGAADEIHHSDQRPIDE